MTLGNYAPGIGEVSEYLASAFPWVTSSAPSGIVQYTFPFVTSFVTVKNVSGSASGAVNANVNVGFTQLGIISSSNFFTLSPGESYTGAFKLSKLFISGSGATINLIAGYTAIPCSRLVEITGSNSYVGVG